ncbi:MAG: hypothetical protein ACK4NF_03120 [Planctomycetota bacterium]
MEYYHFHRAKTKNLSRNFYNNIEVLARKRGAVIVNIIAPPVFVLGVLLCAWTIYLNFHNSKLTTKIEDLTKVKKNLTDERKILDKRIEELESLMGLNAISDDEKSELQNIKEEERKIFFGSEGKDKEGLSQIVKMNNIFKSMDKINEERVENFLLAKAYLKRKIQIYKTKAKDKYLLTYSGLKKDDVEKGGPVGDVYPSYSDLIENLDYLVNLFFVLKHKIESRYETLATLAQYYTPQGSGNENNLFKNLIEIENNMERDIKRLIKDNLQQTCDYIQDVQKKSQDISSAISIMSEKIKTITKSITDEEKNLEGEVKKLRNTLNSLRFVGVLHKDIFNYGGSVVREDFASKIIVISYGTREGLKKGQMFYVFDFFPIGGYRWKGIVEVIEVDKTKAKAKIISENFKHNPIKTGDYLASPLFKKGRKVRVYILGKIAKTTFGFSYLELVEHLQAIGVIVQDCFDLYTDFVITGMEGIEPQQISGCRKGKEGGPQKKDLSQEYKKQQKEIEELGIPVLPLYELLPLLGEYVKTIK